MKLKKYKKAIFEGIFLVVVFLLTVYGVFKGEDLGELMAVIKGTNKGFLSVGIVLVVLFIYSESMIIHYLMNSIGIKLRRDTCFLFSSVGFFFSCITPSASGGQPMQIYFMKKKDIPIPISTLVLMIITITYKLVLVLVGIALLLFGMSLIHTYMHGMEWVFYLGIFLNVVCVGLMLMLVLAPQTATKLAQSTLNFLTKIKILKYKPERIKKLNDSMEMYGQVANFLKSNVKIISNVMLITIVQRFMLFATTYFVYRAIGLKGVSAVVITLLQASISVAVDMLPLPGGMGITEKLFSIVFLPIFGVKFLLPGMVLSRGISYYVQLLLSAVMTLVAKLTIGKNLINNKVQ